MKRLTVSLEAPEYEALVAEAEERDVSKSTVAREVFTAWRDNGLTTSSPDVHTSSQEMHNGGEGGECAAAREALDRIDELEERVGSLEDDGDEDAPSRRPYTRRERPDSDERARRDRPRRPPDRDEDSEGSDTDGRERRSRRERPRRGERRRPDDSDEGDDRRRRRSRHDLPDDVQEAISQWDPPGSGEKAQARTAALQNVVRYLRREGSAKKSDFVSGVYRKSRTDAGYETSDGWYNALVKGVGGQTGGLAYVAEYTDSVKPPGDHTDPWRWTG
jgi:hypothetical protein